MKRDDKIIITFLAMKINYKKRLCNKKEKNRCNFYEKNFQYFFCINNSSKKEKYFKMPKNRENSLVIIKETVSPFSLLIFKGKTLI